MGIQYSTHSGSSLSIFEHKARMTDQDQLTGRNLLIVLFLVTVCLSSASAVNLIACGERLQASLNATNGTSPAPIISLSREECVAECGGGVGDFSWEDFSQNFGTWLLPWITLMFQIPFGGECT